MPVRNDGDVGPRLDDLGARQRDLVRVRRHVLDGGAVEHLGLHEDDRVVAFHGREQEALCLRGRARHDDAQTGDVREEGLGRLGMISFFTRGKEEYISPSQSVYILYIYTYIYFWEGGGVGFANS